MIEIINRQNEFRVSRKRFKRLLENMVGECGLSDPEVTLAFVDSPTIAELNQKFLKKPGPTDVLSFPVGERGPDGKYYLGDIIISVAAAREQAAAKKHSLERELGILVIHGFLHLLGFDHGRGIEEEDAKARRLFLED